MPLTAYAQEQAAPAATPESSDDVRAELAAMRERMAAQEQALELQRQQIEALRAREAARADADADADADAEAEALLASVDAEAAAQVSQLAEDEPLRLYGFMDAGLQKSWGGLVDRGLSPSDASTFLLGNVNLYIDATPAPDWRSLVEVRFTNLPDGSDAFDNATAQTTRVSTRVQDTSAVHGGLTGIRLNGIILERAHIDHAIDDWLNVRVGVFLTPYGIWNVDHGAPVRIMARPPAFMSAELFPERQIGLELFGTIDFLPWQLEYHAYVSNGRQLGAVDFDEDKALGGRLVLGTRRPIGFRLGGSVFAGSSEDVRTVPGVTASGTLGLVPVEQVAYEDLGGAGDVSIDVDRLRIRGEVVALRRTYEDGKRDLYAGTPVPDTMQVGGYLLTAYELPWYHLEPYVVGELIRAAAPSVAQGFAVLGTGLNVYFTPTTQLRLYVSTSWGVNFGRPDPVNTEIHNAGARMVVAF